MLHRCSRGTLGFFLCDTRYLGGNPLVELDSTTFGGLASLQRLWINGCGLTSLPLGLFDGLGRLQHLYLHSNDLSALPEGLFGEDLQALEILDLHENALWTSPSTHELQALHTLNCCSNELSFLSEGLFPAGLQYLYLADNSLGNSQYGVPPGVFDGLKALQTLTLDINDLSTLPAGLFDDLEALTVLSLEGNSGLECMPSTAGSPSLADSKILLPAGFEDGGKCSCPSEELCDGCVGGEDGFVCTGCGSELISCEANRECQECRIEANIEEQEDWEACLARYAYASTCTALSAETCCFEELSTNDCLENAFFVAHAECVVKALSGEECTSLGCRSEVSTVATTSEGAAGERCSAYAGVVGSAIITSAIMTGLSACTALVWV